MPYKIGRPLNFVGETNHTNGLSWYTRYNQRILEQPSASSCARDSLTTKNWLIPDPSKRWIKDSGSNRKRVRLRELQKENIWKLQRVLHGALINSYNSLIIFAAHTRRSSKDWGKALNMIGTFKILSKILSVGHILYGPFMYYRNWPIASCLLQIMFFSFKQLSNHSSIYYISCTVCT